MNRIVKNIEEVKHQIINNSLIVASVVGTIAYLVSLYRIPAVGFHISFVFNFVIIAAVVILTWWREKLSLSVKTYTLIALIFLLALFDAYNFGLLSSTRIYLILIPVFCMVGLSFRRAVIVFIFAIAGFIIIGYLHSKGILSIPPQYVPNVYALEFYPWIIIAVHFILVSVIILLVTRKFITSYSGFISDLETIVAERTSDLEAVNEELKATNEELYNHHEALESTLNDLKNTQNQLLHSEKMASLGVLAAGVAHEINNPLNFISGGAAGIESYVHENLREHEEVLSPLIDGINTGVRRASDIVTSLNQYSRHDDTSGLSCDIHAILDNCLIMLQNQMKYKIEVEKHYTSRNYHLTGNEGKLHQAMLNILVNAVQAIEDKGIITIRTEVQDKYLIVKIADTGSGISEEHITRITEPFFTTKEPGKGTGLGLSITYNILQEHQGTISFESQTGIGTQVTIKLPLNQNPRI